MFLFGRPVCAGVTGRDRFEFSVDGVTGVTAACVNKVGVDSFVLLLFVLRS